MLEAQQLPTAAFTYGACGIRDYLINPALWRAEPDSADFELREMIVTAEADVFICVMGLLAAILE